MKTERRWLKSAIHAAQSEEILLPWAAKRADIQPTPPTPAVIYLDQPAPRALQYAVAA
jgi:hypothetical protein